MLKVKPLPLTSLTSLAMTKRLRVDLQNQLIKVTQLAVGDDAEHHLLLLLFQTAGGVDEGGAAVNLLVDCLVDALVFGTDDHDLCLLLSHNQHLVDDDAGQHDHQNAVEHLLGGGVERLYQQQEDVAHRNHHRDGQTEQLVQDDGRDVHAARWSRRP